jgi:hypothetical protein
MNPFTIVLQDFTSIFGGMPWQGETGAIVLVLRILEAGYTTGWDGLNAWRHTLSALEPYGRNTIIDRLKADWNSKL